MGAALFDDSFPSVVVTSAISYYISGGLFCLWFLNLLIFQSMSSKFPRIVLLVVTKVLMIWLLIMIALITVMLYILSKYTNVAMYTKEYNLLTAGIIFSVFGIVMTSYSFWVTKSYINLLEEEAASRTPRVTFISFPSEDFGELMSDRPKLTTQPPALQENVVKPLISGYGKLSDSPVNQLSPSNIRSSQISMLSSSTLSMLPMTQLLEENSGELEETTYNNEREPSQQKNSNDTKHT